jgi:hypothetical protein
VLSPPRPDVPMGDWCTAGTEPADAGEREKYGCGDGTDGTTLCVRVAASPLQNSHVLAVGEDFVLDRVSSNG